MKIKIITQGWTFEVLRWTIPHRLSYPTLHTIMRLPFQLPLTALLLALTAPCVQAKETKPAIAAVTKATAEPQTLKSPSELSAQLKSSLAKVRPSCVAVYADGYGSGVIISPDGLVLTAAHMMRGIKDDTNLKITLEDGRSTKAKLLGFNRETDFALLQITAPSKKPWPHCELAKTSATTGQFCFTMAHPSGLLKGRPAQVRLGRITSHSIKRDKPSYLVADCNIQPGDSGGPLFSIDGKLIALDSSAASLLALNFFPAIDQYYLDRKKLLNGERWGDDSLAPDGPNFTKTTFDEKAIAAIQKEFMRRIEIKYPPTIDFIQTLKNKKNEVELNQQDIINHMRKDSIAIARNEPLSLGLNDPKLVKLLSPLPTNAVRSIPLYDGKIRIGNGIALDAHHIITKASILPNKKTITILDKKSPLTLNRVSTNKEWDLALLKVGKSTKLPVIKWPSSNVAAVKAGDLLVARDTRQRMLWNVATDQKRAVTKKPSIGPLKDKTIISKHCAPYPTAIRHALTLTAKDAGTPVFNQNGEFIGMHIARISRTMGLIIPAAQLKEQSQKMLVSLESIKTPDQDKNN